MKVKSLLYVLIAGLFVTSCSKEDDNTKTEGTAKLLLTVKSVEPNTKATASSFPLSTDEGKINNVTVGIFNVSGNTDAIVEGTLDSNGKITVTGTAGQRDIVVVANAPAGTFAGATTKSDFLARTLDLVQTVNNLPMAGQSTSSVTLVKNETYPTTVTISRLVARVDLVSLKTNFASGGLYANATFEFHGVFLYKTKSKSDINETPNTTIFQNGYDGTNYVEGLHTEASPAVSITGTAYAIPYYFYAFANSADVLNDATKLVISGIFDPDGAGPLAPQNVYYPIIVNYPQTGTVITHTEVGDTHTGIKRNYIYKIAAIIKSIGVTSVSGVLEPASIELKVEVADWKNVSQTVEY